MIELLLPSWLAGILLTIIAGPLGVFIILRRMSYFGDTLAHTSLLGIFFSLLLNFNLFYTVIIVTLILSILLFWLEKCQELEIDTLLGIIAHSILSIGLVLISLITSIRIDLMAYLFGDLLSITTKDIFSIAISVVIICSIIIWQWRNLLSVTINQDLAFIDGIKIQQIKVLLILITALTISIATKFVGALIITSLLIIPPATCRKFSKTPEQMAIASIIIGIIAMTAGLILSAHYDTPAGPSVVICLSFLFVLNLFFKIKN
ncbi:MAG: zinc ABC transporter permease subunit ZnuB [Arsenophonus sp. ET-YP4-MAG3]